MTPRTIQLLLVEDDEQDFLLTQSLLAESQRVRFELERAASYEAGLNTIAEDRHALCLVDYGLNEHTGLDLLHAIRRNGCQMPLIMLTSHTAADLDDQIMKAGADDYLVKPFSFSELLARIQALIRRASSVTEPTTLTVGDLSLNLVAREVTRAGRRLELQTKEFALLEYLMRHAGKMVSKAMILEHVWDYSFDPQTNVVDVAVCRLRNKIDRDFDTKLIHTMRGVGYVLRAG